MYKKLIFCSTIGEMLEGYDFILYGLYAQILAKLFFPTTDQNLSLLVVYGSFAAGFFTRPLGGMIFGFIGDIFGRKKSFLLSLIIMGVPTILIGLLPTYQTIGVLSPILLVLFRLIQGIAFGGEYTGAILFLGEHAPKSRTGLFCSFSCAGTLIGTLIGSITVAITNWHYSQNITTWEWRIPFIFGGLIVIFSGFFRKKLQETPIFIKNRHHEISKSIIIKKIIDNKKILMLLFLMSIQMSIISYLSIVFLPTYLSNFLGIPNQKTFLINVLNTSILVLLIPLFGFLSDIWGRKPILLVSCFMTLFFSYPLYLLLQTQTLKSIILIQMVMVLLTAMSMSVIPSLILETIPSTFRASSISIAYNLAIAIFGGTTPFIATFLIHLTNNLAAPSYYLIFGSTVSLTALLMYKTPKKF